MQCMQMRMHDALRYPALTIARAQVQAGLLEWTSQDQAEDTRKLLGASQLRVYLAAW